MSLLRSATPRGLPLLGHAHRFWADTNRFLLELARSQGDVASFRIGRQEAWLLSHPDHVRQVLIDDAHLFRKGRLMQRARRLLGDGLLTSEGELHQTQRRRLQPAFARAQLATYGDDRRTPPARAAAARRRSRGHAGAPRPRRDDDVLPRGP